jgi:hypothetical protein
LGAIGLLLHVPHLSVEWVLGWLMAPVGTPDLIPYPPPVATLPAHALLRARVLTRVTTL